MSEIISEGTATHSERAIRRFAAALKCQVFDIRCIHDTTGECTFNERRMAFDTIVRLIPKLRQRNATGNGVYVRPCGSFAFVDDVRDGSLARMLDDGIQIAVVIRTSPGSNHVWVPLAGPLRPNKPGDCVAACEWLADLYGTDHGVVHADSFGRMPGFRNRKPKHEIDGKSPLVEMVNRFCGFRGYDRSLLAKAHRIAESRLQPLSTRSGGPVLSNSPIMPDVLEIFEVRAGEKHLATFSAIDADRLFGQWLKEMIGEGYELPRRQDSQEIDRSQRDLDILRSMQLAGVPPETARKALEAGSDKAQERGASYADRLISAVWGGP